MADNIIDNLSLQINGESEKAISSVDGVLNKLSALKSAITGFNKIKKIDFGITDDKVTALKGLSEAIDQINIQKFREFADATALVNKIDLGIKADTGDNLMLFAVALEQLNMPKFWEFGAATHAIKSFSIGVGKDTGTNLVSFADALEKINLEKLREWGSLGENFQKVDTGITSKTGENMMQFAQGVQLLSVEKLRQLSYLNFGNLKTLSDAAKHVTINFGSYTNVAKGAVQIQEKVAESTQKVSKATKSVGKETHQTSRSVGKLSGAFSKLLSSIGRIAFYRAIRSAIKAVTAGFAEGIENLYYWSQAWGTSFAPRMDQLATAQLYLKNGFSSMFSPLIEYAIPIIDRLIDKLVDVFNVVQQVFAMMTGAPTWNKALKYPVSYKDALDEGTKSAKALQNILMDFDELNPINTPNDSGRASGADAKDYSAMFKLMEVANNAQNPFAWLAPIFDDIRGKIEKLYNIGVKFVDFVKGLDLAPLQTSIESFWATASPIIDEIIEDIDWLRIHVIQPLVQFLTEKAIPAAIDTISAALSAFWSIAKPIIDGLKKFWEDNPWIQELIQDATMQGLEKIQEAFQKIGKFFDKNKGTIKSIFSSLSSISQRLSPFITAISKMLGTHAWDTFVDSISTILMLLEPVLTLLSGILEIVDGLLNFDDRKTIGGIGRIGQAIMQTIMMPIRFVLELVATVIESISYLVGIFDKDAAESMRNFAGQIRGASEELDNMDLKLQQWVEDLENGAGATQDLERNQERANLMVKYGIADLENEVAAIRKIGPQSERDFKLMNDYAAYCKKYGVDPLTGAVDSGRAALELTKNQAKYTYDYYRDEVNKAQYAAQNAANGATKAWQDSSNKIVNAMSAINKNAFPFVDAFSTIGNKAGAAFADAVQKAVNGAKISTTVDVRENTYKTTYIQDVKLPNQAFKSLDEMRAARYASGGYPTGSSLFWAGEAGQPEMLGTIGGRTAVAGGDEITGIREAIYEQGQREETLLRQIVSAVNNKDLSLVANSATGRWVNKALKSYQGVTG